jgi:hypothetical protein
MKNQKLNLLFVIFFSIFSFSQKDSVYVIKETDAMSDKSYLYPNRAFVVSNLKLGVGAKIDCYIKDNLKIHSLMVKMIGLGSCNENDEIIILLENGDKITIVSWKKFNCDGEAYFNLSDSDISKLKSSELLKIRITNGRTFKSLTEDVKKEDKRYFIQLIYALENKKITEKIN